MNASVRVALTFLLCGLGVLGGFIAFAVPQARAAGGIPHLIETPTFNHTHPGVNLPPIAERIPQEPLVVNLEAKGRLPGVHGGDLDTLIGRPRMPGSSMPGAMPGSSVTTRTST